jgi:hypothetical protein
MHVLPAVETNPADGLAVQLDGEVHRRAERGVVEVDPALGVPAGVGMREAIQQAQPDVLVVGVPAQRLDVFGSPVAKHQAGGRRAVGKRGHGERSV